MRRFRRSSRSARCFVASATSNAGTAAVSATMAPFRKRRNSLTISVSRTTFFDFYSDMAICWAILAGMKRFLAGMSQAQQTDGSDKDQTRFDEEFAAIEPIHGVIFQAGIGEQAVPEKSGSCEINRKMEGLPKMAAQSDAQVGSAYYKCDE